MATTPLPASIMTAITTWPAWQQPLFFPTPCAPAGSMLGHCYQAMWNTCGGVIGIAACGSLWVNGPAGSLLPGTVLLGVTCT
jgi:hypothetical protein